MPKKHVPFYLDGDPVDIGGYELHRLFLAPKHIDLGDGRFRTLMGGVVAYLDSRDNAKELVEVLNAQLTKEECFLLQSLVSTMALTYISHAAIGTKMTKNEKTTMKLLRSLSKKLEILEKKGD